jgi:hypothetical protein
MGTAWGPFEVILADFKRNLTRGELQDFQFVTMKDVRETALHIQRDQENLKTMMNMTRLESFLEAMNQFGKVVEVFGSANIFVAFVWGPMKFILQVIFHFFLRASSYLYFKLVAKYHCFLEITRIRKIILTCDAD